MPKKEINNYIFYKIVCISDDIDLCYIGSTANWKARNHSHKNNCNNENSCEYNSKLYKTIRDNGGWCNFKMIEVGKKEQLTKRQSEQTEEEYRIQLKATMNTRRCFRTDEQKQKYSDDNRAKVNCECGCESSKANLLRHKKTKKHIELMSSIKT